MERTHLTSTTGLGQISISSGAIAQLVGHTTAECYGVVGMANRGRLPFLDRCAGHLHGFRAVEPFDPDVEVSRAVGGECERASVR